MRFRSPLRFETYRVALEMIRGLRDVRRRVRMRDVTLASQLERAAASVALNLAEGARRVGRDRLHLFRVASASAAEVRACLDVAEAFGYVGAADLDTSLQFIDRLLAMTWRLTH